MSRNFLKLHSFKFLALSFKFQNDAALPLLLWQWPVLRWCSRSFEIFFDFLCDLCALCGFEKFGLIDFSASVDPSTLLGTGMTAVFSTKHFNLLVSERRYFAASIMAVAIAPLVFSQF